MCVCGKNVENARKHYEEEEDDDDDDEEEGEEEEEEEGKRDQRVNFVAG